MITAVITRRFFGLHLSDHFDDFGFPLPGLLSRVSLRTCRAFCGHFLGNHAEDKDSTWAPSRLLMTSAGATVARDR